MKNLIYIFLLSAFIYSCSPSNTKSGQSPTIAEDLKISACRIYTADFVMIDPNDKGLLLQEFLFNKKGFVHEFIRYDINGEITDKFDLYGELTPFPTYANPEYIDTVLMVIEIDSIGEIMRKELKTYNSDGLLIESSFYGKFDVLQSKNTYEYNNNGMIICDIYWDVELMKPKQIVRYEYEYFSD
ncbi:MAG: hypothetical protein JEZ09_08870 [Salinivirgaceae bacterium]|nr:hypothetical protein [Salinivirgaceae bacterium]